MDQENTYLVGGAVRDGLMGLPVKDRDFVVVGSSASEMEELGYLPVGSDFPVFLHPETKEEYALARTERKSGKGYKGFTFYAEPDVTLEEDLGRRDLTINAIALSPSGVLVDPYNGQVDIKTGVLRHVRSETFVEDPVRVLRLARFTARFKGFVVADETMQLVRTMVDRGDMDHLVPERVWQEMVKGLMEDEPSRMIETLRECGALKILLPEVDCLFGVDQPAAHHPEIDSGVHVLMVLDQAAKKEASIQVRFSALMHDLGKGLTPKELLPSHHDHESAGVELVRNVCARLKVPAACRDLALITCKEHTHVHRALVMKNSSIVNLFERTDAIRRPARFEEFLDACEFDARGRLGLEDREYPQKDYLLAALEIVRSVDVGAIAIKFSHPHLIDRIHEARVKSLSAISAGDFMRELGGSRVSDRG